MPLLPDYLGHDTEYRRRRAQGQSGWSDDISLRQTIASINLFLAELSLPAAPTLIEFGCGAGDLSLHFAARGFHVTGFDIAPFAVEWAREKASQQSIIVSFIAADLTRDLDPLPPPADVVLDGLCLHYIIGPDRETFFRNVWRCLKPNGVFVVNTMCGNPHPPNDRDFDPISRCIVTRGIARRYFGTAESIVQEVIQSGFRVDRHQVIHAQYPGDEDALLIKARLHA